MQAGGLTTEERARYEKRQRENMRPLMAFGLVAGAVLFVAHASWDSFIAGMPFSAMTAAQLSCALLLLTLVPLVQLSLFRSRPELLLYAGVFVGATFVSLVASHLPVGYHYATGALLLMILVISALAPSLRASVISSLVLLIAFTAVALLRGVTFLEKVAVFAPTGAIIGCVMCEVRSRIRQRVFGLEVELERVARTDMLSGVLTRRAFIDSSAIEFRRAERYHYPVAVLMLDIDHFKGLNDTFGHALGDDAIRALGDTCRKLLRTSDLIGRLGGEEFAVVLPHTDAAAAVPLANRLREAINAATLKADGKDISFTVSVGVAMRLGAEPVLDTISRADRALYDAKHAGRNRVMPARAV